MVMWFLILLVLYEDFEIMDKIFGLWNFPVKQAIKGPQKLLPYFLARRSLEDPLETDSCVWQIH